MSISDDAQNKAEDLKGRAKEAAGAVSGNEDLKTEGKADQVEAQIKDKVADVADAVKSGVDAVKDKLSGN
ncbi:CsbD family protein OS=Tsukamurella paurometabola (strain ATCC 8368 / DSM / CCUG 35730 / CIP 100753 / JCM 10117 / KCTC 9821 / NBRC 16120 / NCIMB 702349/ NCTC 13040) OX=521096 GN=Tpau_0295 PE=3 SV=1 [Tsukamurella paurometabola]|uniref:CsbD family protein n=1 Tax=Tsukamurella paurometabola (strain ATCC 8368 / DSM 20162 / CCUG 35730 / CIP 100753 / JCM 10117 / KCTC 9821 / NBRC 16120 / NCIMB 702349 / NCTC 13040) TaxID=521096 RepID=D5UQV8_TSUPD|nr:CsbD family protein [Tsukamurella paurometabola]ADG76941.1 CsbD family protein [Tsukamurella paurometabola DSM 20162]SUP42286.1 CsbD-like [Tsukamurella paurometabola]